MTPGEKLLRDIFEDPKAHSTETRREKLSDAIYYAENTDDLIRQGYEDIVPLIMPLIEEHTRLAVEKALAEQREAIADALIEAQKLHPSNAYWCQDLDQAARIVRDFGKES